MSTREFELPVKEGDLAPLFSAKAGAGAVVALADLRGRNVVLYFYPRDNTPGCTIEACQFRDQFEDFKKRGLFCSTSAPIPQRLTKNSRDGFGCLLSCWPTKTRRSRSPTEPELINFSL